MSEKKQDIETIDKNGNEIVLKDVPVSIYDGEAYISIPDLKDAEKRRKRVEDLKEDLKDVQWRQKSGYSISINDREGLRETLQAILELYDEVGFGWFEFGITWKVRDMEKVVEDE